LRPSSQPGPALWLVLIVCGAGTAAAALLAPLPRAVGARGAQDAQPRCVWREAPAQVPPRLMAAGVFDDLDARLYTYGGLDPSGSPSASLHAVELGSADIDQVVSAAALVQGQQPEPRWGHAGVFRLDDSGEPEIYWIGGQRGGRFLPTATPVTVIPRPTATRTPP